MDAKTLCMGSEDAFSSLPDHVLCHILSFLSTKHAASTSVLSSRWRDLFALVPNLDFDDSMFLDARGGTHERDDILRCFMEFVDRVLALRGGIPINEFSLKCRNAVDPACINNWICNVLERGVLDLTLLISPGREYSLPSELFTSKTLVKLTIMTLPEHSRLPLDVCFPVLRTLYLGWFGFEDDGTVLNRLLSGCPVLEELIIPDLAWEASNGFSSVSIATLKRLTLRYKGDCHYRPGVFSFDTPNLVYLEYSDFVADEYPVVNLDALVEARLDLQLSEVNPRSDATDLIMGISNVQILSLSAETLEVLSLFCKVKPVFENLICLSIEIDGHFGWTSLPILLRNSPKLETLVVKGLLHYCTNRYGCVCICNFRKNMSCFLSSCPVKTLKISGFQGTLREMEIVEHFLEKLPCLEEMMICASVNDDKLWEVCKDLMMRPSASSKAKIRVM